MKKGTYVMLEGLTPRDNDNKAIVKQLNNRVGEVGRVVSVHNGCYHIDFKDGDLKKLVLWCYVDEIRPLTTGERLLYELNGPSYLREHHESTKK